MTSIKSINPIKYNIQSFECFLNEFELEGEVQQSKPLWNGKDYLDGHGSINISSTDLFEFPCIFPETINKSLWCNDTNITSLYGSPKYIEGGKGFIFYKNKLTSLKGGPLGVSGNFDVRWNELTSLKYSPIKVSSAFKCSHNNITSLIGAPKEVGWFECDNNELTSLEGAPKYVEHDFSCRNNLVKFTEEDVRKVCQVGGKIYV